MSTKHAKPANPDRPYYAAEDFAEQGHFALYAHGARCRGGYSREKAEQAANEANDPHERNAKRARLTNAAPDMLAALEKAAQDLTAAHVVNAILHEAKHPHAPKFPEPESLALIRAAIARATLAP